MVVVAVERSWFFHSQSDISGERWYLVDTLPGHIVTTKVTVDRCAPIDRLFELKILDNAAGAQVEVTSNQLLDDRIVEPGNLPVQGAFGRAGLTSTFRW